MGVSMNCTLLEGERVLCNGTIYGLPEERLSYIDKWFWIYLGIYVLLVLLAGLVSGLTMGLLSLDMMTLKILQDGGTPKERKYAARILPVVKRHHLLLVTLLLVNAGAVEAMPIFLDHISDPITAICVSVTAVLLFGEVFPQALCTRFGLAIGATLTPFVYILMVLVGIIAWPLSKLLDCLLGSEHTTFYRRAELKALVDLHGPTLEVDPENNQPHEGQEPLTVDEVLIIKGALDMKDKVVENAMLPLKDVYMLGDDVRLGHDTMNSILSCTHSRIPIYGGDKQNILGLLLVKMLIKFDPDEEIPLKTVMKDSTCFRNVPSVCHNMPLFDLLNLFQTGKSHLCLVKNDGSAYNDGNDTSLNPMAGVDEEVIGIITLEDVIEELIQEEIIDETDVFVDIQKRIRVARAKAARQVSYLSDRSQPHPGRIRTHRSFSNPENSERSDTLPATGTRRQLSDEPPLDLSSEDNAPLLSNQDSPYD